MRILVTGATGFLGLELIRCLQGQHEVTALSRSGKPLDGCEALVGDIVSWNLGLEPTKFIKKFDAFIHLAGLYNLRAAESDMQLTNVIGTHNALSFAVKAQIPVFAMASTVAVTVNQGRGLADPYVIDLDKSFPDAYARTKAAAEHHVRREASKFKLVLNFRLGALVGSLKSGHILRADGPYSVAQSLEKVRGLIARGPDRIPMPGTSKRRIPILPVDVAAKAMADLVQISQDKKLLGFKSFNLVPEKGILVKEFYRDCFDRLGFPNKKAVLTETLAQKATMSLATLVGAIPKEEARYMLDLPSFDCRDTQDLLGPNWCPEYSDYKETFWRGYEQFVQNR